MHQRGGGILRRDPRHIREGTAGLGRDEDYGWRDRHGHRGDFSREGTIGQGGAHGPKGWNDPRGRGKGPYAGRGPRGYRRSDERLREEICERMTDDPDLDAGSLEVGVQNGVAVLSGEVDDRESKYLADDIADSVHGVLNVENRIRVRRPVPEPVESYELYVMPETEGIGREGARKRAKESRGPKTVRYLTWR